MNAVKTNLKRLRIARKMTQDELAEKLHVVRQTVSSWETGKTTPDVETLTAIAEALDADISELIYGAKPVDVFAAIRSKQIKRAIVLIGITFLIALMSVYWLDIFALFKITSGYNPDFTHNLRNRIMIMFGKVYLSSLACWAVSPSSLSSGHGMIFHCQKNPFESFFSCPVFLRFCITGSLRPSC